MVCMPVHALWACGSHPPNMGQPLLRRNEDTYARWIGYPPLLADAILNVRSHPSLTGSTGKAKAERNFEAGYL